MGTDISNVIVDTIFENFTDMIQEPHHTSTHQNTSRHDDGSFIHSSTNNRETSLYHIIIRDK